MEMAASKRFHKFWFLVLENPGSGRDFLVIGHCRSTFFLLSMVKGVELFLYLHHKSKGIPMGSLFRFYYLLNHLKSYCYGFSCTNRENR